MGNSVYSKFKLADLEKNMVSPWFREIVDYRDEKGQNPNPELYHYF